MSNSQNPNDIIEYDYYSQEAFGKIPHSDWNYNVQEKKNAPSHYQYTMEKDPYGYPI